MNHNYGIVLYWSDEDSVFIAEVPELAGCNALGSTYEDAIREVLIVMDAWIEIAQEKGWTIPEPKGRLTSEQTLIGAIP